MVRYFRPPEKRNSLYFSLFAGNSRGEGLERGLLSRSLAVAAAGGVPILWAQCRILRGAPQEVPPLGPGSACRQTFIRQGIQTRGSGPLGERRRAAAELKFYFETYFSTYIFELCLFRTV